MKKKQTNLIIFLVLAGILVVFYITGESYYEGLTGKRTLHSGRLFMAARRNGRRRMMQFLNFRKAAMTMTTQSWII